MTPDQLLPYLLPEVPGVPDALAERSIMRTCNPHLSLVDSRHLFNHLYEHAPYLAKQQAASPQVREAIERRHAHDVAWINQRFFGGEPVVGLGATEPGEAANPLEQAQASYEQALGFVLGKLNQREGELHQLAHFLADPQRIACPPETPAPPGFDPVGYLLLYRDVLVSGMNPWIHYDLYGRAEGRLTAPPP